MKNHNPQRDCVNGKDCDAREEQERKMQDESRIGVQNVHWQDGPVVGERQIGRNIATTQFGRESRRTLTLATGHGPACGVSNRGG